MNTLQPGDEVDYQGLRGGRVLKVGLGTIWAEFPSPAGTMSVNGPSVGFRLARREPVRIGAFVLSLVKPGVMQMKHDRFGSTEVDEARLEGVLEKFWHRQFE